MKYILKEKKIIKFVIFAIMIYLFIILGAKEYHIDVEDNIRFTGEYQNVPKNNLYTYVNEDKVLEILNEESGIIFMGFPSNLWSHYYAEYLNEAAMNNQIKEIYYYNFFKDRQLNNKKYLMIVEKLKKYLVVNDRGERDIWAPTVVIVEKGNVLYFNNDMINIKGDIKPQDYFTDVRKNLLKNNFDVSIKMYKGSE